MSKTPSADRAERLRTSLEAELTTARAELATLRLELEATQAELDAARAERQAAEAERDAASRWLQDGRELASTQVEQDASQATWDAAQAEQVREQAEQIVQLRQTLDGVLRSKSWRLTAPMREGTERLRGVRQQVRESRDRNAVRLERLLRRVYLRLPLGEPHLRVVRRWGFAIARPLLRGTLTYAHWQESERRARAQALALADTPHAEEIARLRDGLVLPRVAARVEPDVSIVMPVFGQLVHTLRALHAVARHWPRASCEVIVVDDASPDDSAEQLAHVPGLRLLRQTRNEGFIRSSNHGARAARGRFLIFLNNDTEVLPGWCDELIRTFTDLPQAGIVGAKLLYPDGRLQEAGGIIWRDGSGWNYGRGDNPERPEYCYRREVDYVSGAALAIPRELFQRVSGFDERYLPAYGEDSDLAFKVRELGRAVIYQPLAQVIHTEGATAGTDTTHGVKAYQVENARRLFERWQPRLALRPRPGADAIRARDRRAVCRVLVLDHCTPEPDKDAGSITALNIMRLLQRLGCKVSFMPEDNFLALERYTADLQRLGIECHYAPFVNSVDEHLREHGDLYDVVVIFRFTTARRHLDTVRRYCRRAKVILHTSDLHFLRETREAELHDDPLLLAHALQTRHDELAVIRRVDSTVVHSPVEQTLLRRLCPEAPVRLFGWAIDIPGTSVPFASRQGIAFLGGYQHVPNVDAVQFFVQDVFPLIKPRLPDVTFYAIGSHPPDALQALATTDVVITGFVQNLGDHLDRVRIAIAPLRYGAGIKGKVVTAMSHGLPGVITSVAAEGIGVTDGEDVLIADTPESIADAIVALYTDGDLWTRLSQAGLTLVRERFGFESGLPIVRELLESVGLPVGVSDEHAAAAAAGPRLSGPGQRASAPAPRGSQEPRHGGPPPASPRGAQDPRLDGPPPPSALECVRVSTQMEYAAHLAADAARIAQRARVEADLRRADALPFDVDGYCIACHAPSRFRVGYEYSVPGPDGRPSPNWREHLVCSCGLNARTRLAIHVLTELSGISFDDPIYLMEQTSPLYRWLHRGAPRLVGSEFLGDDVERGSISADGIRHEDATRLTFADEAFAHILSFDVLEHVPDYRRAFAECARCLRPGGRLLFTAPFRVDAAQTIVRARVTADGTIEYLLPPERHGDPRQADGILCFQHFGWDVLDDLRTAGFATAEALFVWSRPFGYLGGEQVIFQAVKS